MIESSIKTRAHRLLLEQPVTPVVMCLNSVRRYSDTSAGSVPQERYARVFAPFKKEKGNPTLRPEDLLIMFRKPFTHPLPALPLLYDILKLAARLNHDVPYALLHVEPEPFHKLIFRAK